MEGANLILPTAEPFLYTGGRIGCLLVHGFTGTPKEMHEMGIYLAKQGYTVLGVRLTGHATTMEDMARMRWWDWLASVEDGFHLLRGITDQQFVMGLSMGGALSLLAASHYPFAGVVSMSAPYELEQDWRLNYVNTLAKIQPHVEKGPPDWRNPEAAADHVAYPYYPTRSVGELRELLGAMRDSLPKIKIPALLVHSKLDKGVLPASMERIYEKLGSGDKEKIWLVDSGHVITREPERMLVFENALTFMKRVCQSEQVSVLRTG